MLVMRHESGRAWRGPAPFDLRSAGASLRFR